MDQVINNLKNKEIIYGKTVAVLKKYINAKYPSASPEYVAEVFADAVHKILDEHVKEFSRDYQRKIKHDLLIRTAKKEDFEIVAYDIMKTCVALGVNEETFFQDLTSWINHQQALPVYRHQIETITGAVRDELIQEGELQPAIVAPSEVAGEEEAAVKRRKDLLSRLNSAMDYDPYMKEGSDDTPELYVQGEVNAAFEAEMLKDAQLNDRIGGSDLALDDSLWALAEETEEVVSAQPPESYLNLEDWEVSEDDNTVSGPQTYDPEAYEGGQQEEVISEEETADSFTAAEESEQAGKLEDTRPVIKVEKEIEPYFSPTPDLWEDSEGNVPFVVRISNYIKALDMKTVIMISAALLVLISLIAWGIWTMLSGEGQPEEIGTTTDRVELAESIQEESVIPESLDQSDQVDDRRGGGIDADHLDLSIRYKEIDAEALRAWLLRNESLVGEEPHFTIILEVAREYGVNPLLLFAITGQEQGFVPKDHESAGLMINNPFNVYGSWENYNTDLKESAQIAARTILTASENKPSDADPVEWINITYAEDRNWAAGVNLILEQFEIVAGR